MSPPATNMELVDLPWAGAQHAVTIDDLKRGGAGDVKRGDRSSHFPPSPRSAPSHKIAGTEGAPARCFAAV